MNQTESLLKLLKIKYPIIQAGMVWTSGAKLAAASANAGTLGVIGAGSMKPDLLRLQIIKAQSLSSGSIGINIPLLYKGAEEQINLALSLGIKIFITSAGSPKTWTRYLKEKGAIVIHVTSTPALALKCEEAGVDAVIAEGFEAGGHNGRDEITTLCLIPQVVDQLKIPVIAAGGIADARAMAAAFCLGASAVQMGTRFLMTQESSAHINFKNLLLTARPDSTMLVLKKQTPVRIFKNKFFEEIKAIEDRGGTKEELEEVLGHGRAKLGILEGELNDGELEIGQVASLIKDLPTVNEMVQKLIKDFNQLPLKPLFEER